MTVLQFPARNPRCSNCKFWLVFPGSPSGYCEKKDELTNSDYRCGEHAEKAG